MSYTPPPVPPAAPPPAPPPGQPPPPGPPYGVPPGAPSEEVRSAEQKALIGLILGICNFVICGLLCIPALILGNQALAVLDRPGVQSNSRNMANWARILGIIGIILLVVAVVVWVVVMIVIAVTGGAAAMKSSP